MKWFLVALGLALFFVGPVATVCSVNALAGRDVVPLSFDTWLSALWLTALAGVIASQARK